MADMDNVTPIKPDAPIYAFICAACQCDSFTFRSDHTVTCCGCDQQMSIDIFEGAWVPDSAPIVATAPDRKTVLSRDEPNAGFTLRRALNRLADVVHVIVMWQDGAVTAYGCADSIERMKWIDRRIAEARGLMMMHLKGDNDGNR